MDPLAQRLRSEREQRRLSVRDVSVVTKIREPYIEAIEAGRYDVLPAVYVKSFIKTLAQTLEISPNELADLLDVVFDSESETHRLPRVTTVSVNEPPNVLSDAVQRASRGLGKPVDAVRDLASSEVIKDALSRKNAYLYIGAGVLVILALVYLIVFYSSSDTRNIEAVPDVEVRLDAVPDVNKEDSIVLRAVVIDTAWLAITSDGVHTQQLTLLPGKEYKWSANEQFVLSISNAGGVRFYRNGQILPSFGNQGEAVRSIRISRTDIVSSAQTPGVEKPKTPGIEKPKTREIQNPKTPESQNPKTNPKTPETQSVKPKPKAPVATKNKYKNVNPRTVPLITPAPTQSPIQRPDVTRPPKG